MQYQVPLELLVLARNREKDKARSVAVTPVAPRPSVDEPPPSSELSALRAPAAATAPSSERADAGSGQTRSEPLAAPEAAVSSKSSTAATLVFLVAALCLIAGYCAVELLHLY
jgi:hypothetical protein